MTTDMTTQDGPLRSFVLSREKGPWSPYEVIDWYDLMQTLWETSTPARVMVTSRSRVFEQFRPCRIDVLEREDPTPDGVESRDLRRLAQLKLYTINHGSESWSEEERTGWRDVLQYIIDTRSRADMILTSRNSVFEDFVVSRRCHDGTIP
ncbi:hypothetical protein BDZ90DRAFT_92395 [Jaminaea rosea]|uniref:Uncharacterized protein n=1 Tax=Jaminaea rosea TaxID=1569628 RepID=A0A316UID5_9BASI|nr:hypothetical protein BDZ90DRAFT_92395 [Jaminaea rosea]PWN25036.1 hypothetical protein BDZ90DRAFT_92395 [Jaminaea rosea]